jgi:hypothetical protein
VCYVTASTRPTTTGGVPDAMLVSPITGETVPADKLSEHLRIGKLILQLALLYCSTLTLLKSVLRVVSVSLGLGG